MKSVNLSAILFFAIITTLITGCDGSSVPADQEVKDAYIHDMAKNNGVMEEKVNPEDVDIDILITSKKPVSERDLQEAKAMLGMMGMKLEKAAEVEMDVTLRYKKYVPATLSRHEHLRTSGVKKHVNITMGKVENMKLWDNIGSGKVISVVDIQASAEVQIEVLKGYITNWQKNLDRARRELVENRCGQPNQYRYCPVIYKDEEGALVHLQKINQQIAELKAKQ